MKFKEFFKLSWIKAILAIVLFLLFSLFIPRGICVEGGITIGSPFMFLSSCNNQPSATALIINENVKFDFISFIIDLIVWYLISCLIIFVYNKIKNAKK